MATDQLMAPLPQVTLTAGMKIVFEAVDPATGGAVAGVNVEDIAIYGADLSDSGVTLDKAGPFLLVPGPEA